MPLFLLFGFRPGLLLAREVLRLHPCGLHFGVAHRGFLQTEAPSQTIRGHYIIGSRTFIMAVSRLPLFGRLLLWFRFLLLVFAAGYEKMNIPPNKSRGCVKTLSLVETFKPVDGLYQA